MIQEWLIIDTTSLTSCSLIISYMKIQLYFLMNLDLIKKHIKRNAGAKQVKDIRGLVIPPLRMYLQLCVSQKRKLLLGNLKKQLMIHLALYLSQNLQQSSIWSISKRQKEIKQFSLQIIVHPIHLISQETDLENLVFAFILMLHKVQS